MASASDGRGIPAFLSGSAGKRHVIGLVGVILLLQVFMFLGAEQASWILPGNWTPFVPIFNFFLQTTFAAIFFLILPRKNGTSPLEDIKEFSFRDFLRNYALVFGLTWIAVLGIFIVGFHETLKPLADVTRLQQFVYVFIFVAPTEELLFRVALPKHFPWWATSGIGFAVYHLWAYSLQVPIGDIQALLSQMLWAGILGIVFYAIYTKYGYGGAMGAHGAYDGVVLGALGTFGLAGASLWWV